MNIILTILSAIGGLGFIITTILAIVGYVSRESLKFLLEKRIREFQSSIDNNIYISKYQFEKEYSIYQGIWEKLIDLKFTTLELRPQIEFNISVENKNQERERKLIKFAEDFNEFLLVYQYGKPFYSKEVFEELKTIDHLSRKEEAEYHFLHTPEDKGYWSEASKQNKEIIAQVDKCCESIRNRIESYKIIDR
ncbi:hypothetical protein ABK905_09475 [Acerihabitans sp. KWT182]|uniref:DUF4760 domain-containing protein n=1 Tax=Acerihabitans sp. KWT182 TaxID=3157919 RepID=A0AAU7QDB1_9GAMM